MTKRQALQIALRQNPGMRMINGVEYKEFFGFNLAPTEDRDAALFANGSLFIVYKTIDKTEWLSGEEILSKYSWPPISTFKNG